VRPPEQIIEVPPDTRPTLAVVIHTEEEFDWNQPQSRDETGVEHMRHMGRAQAVFERFGIVPNYVIGYPTATQETGFALLKEYAAEGRALIGTHLHPWVCPPYEEEINAFNTYPGNLPPDLERAKLEFLTEAIQKNLGITPKTYLAGRYGNGPNSLQILADLGYEVDISVAPPIDYSSDGGPDYSGWTCAPAWRDARKEMLILPGAGGYAGLLRRGGGTMYKLVTQQLFRTVRLAGILSRSGLFERSRLSPEDYSLSELKRLTRNLVSDGIRYLVFSFHSPSVDPGRTPYVKTQADLDHFLRVCERYFEFFFGDFGGRTVHPLEIKAELAGL
jgi:hypothetical protein